MPRARAVLAGSASTLGRVEDERLAARSASSSASVGSMNIVFANSAWYGCVVTTRTRDPVLRIGAGEGVDDVDVPPPRCAVTLSRSRSKRSSASGWLTSPHQIRSSEPGSRTTNLSFGERPVWPAGVDDERPALGEPALAALDRVRVEPSTSSTLR